MDHGKSSIVSACKEELVTDGREKEWGRTGWMEPRIERCDVSLGEGLVESICNNIHALGLRKHSVNWCDKQRTARHVCMYISHLGLRNERWRLGFGAKQEICGLRTCECGGVETVWM